MVTLCAEVYVPAPGLNVGAATGVLAGALIVYVALATALSVMPAAKAIALIVVLLFTAIDPL
jgi:hypothetical protein